MWNVNNKIKHVNNIILKMKAFYDLKSKAYPHDRLNISKGVVRNRELFPDTPEEIHAALGKQGVTNGKRINKKGSSKNPNTYVYLNF